MRMHGACMVVAGVCVCVCVCYIYYNIMQYL